MHTFGGTRVIWRRTSGGSYHHTRTAPTPSPRLLPPRVAVANFEVYYELDDDLSRHVLNVASYLPDGPDNSWVLLERD